MNKIISPFKVRDWVKAIKEHDDEFPTGYGIVINVRRDTGGLTVLFPEWDGGHSDHIEKAPIKYRSYVDSCWNYNFDDARTKLLKKEKTLRELLKDKNER